MDLFHVPLFFPLYSRLFGLVWFGLARFGFHYFDLSIYNLDILISISERQKKNEVENSEKRTIEHNDKLKRN